MRALVLALALLISGVATAQEIRPRRTSIVEDGKEYEGEVVEEVPNDHLTLWLADGQMRRFDLRRAVLPPIVLDADDAATMLERKQTDGSYVSLCVMPCAAVPTPGFVYRLSGTLLFSTADFPLRAADNTIAGRMRSKTPGLVLTFLGGVFGAVGLATALVWATHTCADPCSANVAYGGFTAVFLIPAAAMLIPGILMLFGRSRAIVNGEAY